MNQETQLKIFFGLLIIIGLYILFKSQVELFAPVYTPYRKRSKLDPYRSYYYYPFVKKDETYQDFMGNASHSCQASLVDESSRYSV